MKTILLAALMCQGLHAQRLADLSAPAPGSTLVVGFLGGFERWDDPHRGVRQLVLKLRQSPGVYAESVSNHHRRVALEWIRRALKGGDARLILFGKSWGAGAAIETARDLDNLGIPVLLTVQVDSVGLHDRMIPPNVREAVNFYQHDLFTIQGRREIAAANPARTRILGNFQSSYALGPAEGPNASWARRAFGGSHAKMELDPVIWSQVELYIRDAIAGR